MMLIETWVEGKDWEKYRERLLVGYKWRIQEAKRKNRKGEAMGGMILGIRKELVVREEKDSKKIEEMMIGKMKYGKRILRVWEYI